MPIPRCFLGAWHKRHPKLQPPSKLTCKIWAPELRPHNKVEQTISRANQNTAHIQDLQVQLDTLKLMTWRTTPGLPETVMDTHLAIKSFIKDIIPDIQEHCLELDRAHRALHPPRSDGLPRDIVVKPHLLRKRSCAGSRNAEQLNIQGHRSNICESLFGQSSNPSDPKNLTLHDH